MANTPVEALQEAVDRAGSQSALAVLIGCSQQSLSRFLVKGHPVTAELAPLIEGVTGVSRSSLRPDLWPAARWLKAAG